MQFDGKLDIAIGASRRTKKWKNKSITWSDLLGKLFQATVTKETFKEYMALPAQEQSEIKDVGGYVGGYLHNGKRSPRTVIHRQILTLDVDFAHEHFWEDFCLLFGNAAVLHATHKHHESSPRLRLVMPLSREATPEEYLAVARRIAGDLNIELFDNTTFQNERLMYWPSIPSDVEYYFRSQDGPWVDVDQTLDRYIDWKDTSLWPTSQAFTDKVNNHVNKQQDPEEKAGLIGAFCRTYTITDCLEEFLNEQYKRVDDTRYTYTLGSTSGGLILYQDKFAFSHHGTDPVSGKLCNSFDLVRIHRFGHLDEASKATKALPSFKAMQEFVLADEKVRATMAKEKVASAEYDFAEDLQTEEDLSWMKKLEVDKQGQYLSTASNLTLIFDNDIRLAEVFRDNEFDNKRYIFKNAPWRRVDSPSPVRDVDMSGLRSYIESIYGISSQLKIKDALNLAADTNSFHPIRDYLSGLTWDKTERVDRLLIDYFGATDTVYTREAIRKTLVAAVARVFDPGAKFDLVLTLVGPEGTGKSTFANKLGRQWFSDTFMTVHGKESFEQLHGAWIMEMAELSGLRKAEVEAIKHYITKREDQFRIAYGEVVQTYPRQCVFIATTNNKDFLKGTTGNRRFIPVDVDKLMVVKDVFTDLTDDEVDQIWAEAYQMYLSGEKLFMSAEAAVTAKEEQAAHSERDIRTGIIEAFLERRLPVDWDSTDLLDRRVYLEGVELSPNGEVDREYVCTPELWCECFGHDKKSMDRFKVREINDIMRTVPGWEIGPGKKTFPLYGRQRYFYRTDQ